jgi:ABC-type multidrug transport system fused ATPase/permease subunit
MGGYFGTKYTVKYADLALQSYTTAGGIADSSISSIRTLAALNGQYKQIKKYSSHLDQSRTQGKLSGFVNAANMAQFEALFFFTYPLAFYMGAIAVAEQMDKGCYTCQSGGKILAAVWCALTGIMAISMASPGLAKLAAAKSAAKEIFALIDRDSKIDPLSKLGQIPSACKGHIEFRGKLTPALSPFPLPLAPLTRCRFSVSQST